VHEYSIARSILESVVSVQHQEQLGSIPQVDVELGEFSGVEPVQLQAAYAALSLEILGYPSEMQIQIVRLRGRCGRCQDEFVIENFQFHCPACSSNDVQIVSGDELRILAVSTLSQESEP